MMRGLRISVIVMLVVTLATVGYAQTGAMTADQMKMMSEHMQMMADRMKDGQMSPEQMKMMGDHMTMMGDHMKGKK